MVSLIRQIGGDTDGEGVDVQHRRIQRMLEETLTKNMHLQVCQLNPFLRYFHSQKSMYIVNIFYMIYSELESDLNPFLYIITIRLYVYCFCVTLNSGVQIYRVFYN